MTTEPIPCCALLANGQRCPLPVHHDPTHNAAREPDPPRSERNPS